MKYAIVTFGCRVNQADSLRIEEALRARGAAEAPVANADVVVVNTCSVTAAADQGARQTIRRIARENPAARLVVTGCYATREPDTVAALPGVVRLLRNRDKERLQEAAAELFDPRGLTGDGPCGAPIEPGFAGRTAFTLRVQTGCEERCTYCIIPTTRGPGRSVPLSEVVREVRRIAASGFREIVLTGVHLGSYGRDLEPRNGLIDLLHALGSIPEDVVFRISSLEPMDCTREIVELVAAGGGRFAAHFHLPLQHASDPVLARMARPYTLDRYRGLVDVISDRIPGASIGADLIAGFPGETDEEFASNLEYLPDSPLSHLHVFPYSDRPGTPASALPGKVPGPIVRARGAELRRIAADLSRTFRARQVGTTRQALVIDDGTVAVTDNYLKLAISPRQARNTRVHVRIDGEMEGTVVTTGRRAEARPTAVPAPGRAPIR